MNTLTDSKETVWNLSCLDIKNQLTMLIPLLQLLLKIIMIDEIFFADNPSLSDTTVIQTLVLLFTLGTCFDIWGLLSSKKQKNRLSITILPLILNSISFGIKVVVLLLLLTVFILY